MNANLPRNPDPTCLPPYQFWTCVAINFRGCCILDACKYSGCPDSATPTTTSASSPTGQQNPSTASSAAASSAASTSLNVAPSTQSASQAAASSQSSSSPSQQTSQAPQTASAAASASTSSYQGSSQTTPTSLSSQDPVTVLVTSSIFITPTSNGITLAPTQWPITSTSTSPASVAPSTSNIPSDSGAASSGSSSKTPIIAGVVGGVGAISILALLLGLFWWRRRARTGAEEKAKHAYDNDPRLEGIDANRAGDTFGGFTEMYPSDRADLRARNHQSFVSSEGSAAGTDSNMEKRSPVSPVHPHIPKEMVTQAGSSMAHPGPNMTNLAPGPTGNTAELTGIPANNRFTELPPDSERLAINKPDQTSDRPMGQAATVPDSNVSLLWSTIGLSGRDMGEQAASTNRNRPHVMSWMEYNGGNGGGLTSTL